MKKNLNWIDLGLISYEEAFKHQEELHQKCADGFCEDTLLFQENHPIITLGRGSHEKNLLYSTAELASMGIGMTSVSRGGDISYHGNGQLIISPILHFERYIKTAHQYVRCLEEIVINLLETYHIPGKRVKGLSGVWVVDGKTGEDKKISALGIAVSHGVTLHGLSINVNPNMSHFSTIIPCGIEDKGVTSMEAYVLTPPSLVEIRNAFIVAFDNMFGTQTVKRMIEIT